MSVFSRSKAAVPVRVPGARWAEPRRVGKRQREEGLIELKGAARQEQVSRHLDRLCSEEGGWGNDWAFSQGLPYMSLNPAPEWTFRPLWSVPGEWREGTGVSTGEERRVRPRLARVRSGASYGERMRTLAAAAGSFGTLLNLGWGRYIDSKPRVESAGLCRGGAGRLDDSGVT